MQFPELASENEAFIFEEREKRENARTIQIKIRGKKIQRKVF